MVKRSFWFGILLIGGLLLGMALHTVAYIDAAQAQTYELHFWPGEAAEQDSRFVQISPHPCGTVAV
ncbi:MAG: hypothetical protein AAGC54_04055, partial [Cyanobacteria bacterium P01_F01_bin.4]